MPPTNTCQIHVGRLLEIDLSAGFRSPADVNDVIIQVETALRSTPGQVVLVADWRGSLMLAPEVAEHVAAMMNRNNPRIERHALLQDAQQPTCMLQLVRLVKEARNDRRRAFTDPEALQAWLDPVLDESERKQLRSFVSRRG